MNKAYLTAANHAAAYERVRNFKQARMMWLAALRHAGQKNKEWCENRANFCYTFWKYQEKDNEQAQ